MILDAARDVSAAIWLQDRWRRYLEPSHVRYYTTQELQALVRSVGFRLSEPVITMKRFMFKRKLFTGLMLLRCIKGEHPQHQSSVSVRTPETPISFRQGTS